MPSSKCQNTLLVEVHWNWVNYMVLFSSSDTMDGDPDLCHGKKDGVAEKVP